MKKKRTARDIQREILHNLFDITVEQYEQVWKSQKGRCAICGVTRTKDYGLTVDYIYKENRIRGLVCENCHLIIDQIENNPELFKKAALYLEINK